MRHVLVVEDNPTVLDLVVEVLDGAGYRVTAAPSLGSARRALAAGRVDIVVADVGIGNGDGRLLEGAMDVAGNTPHFVLMSGYGRESLAITAGTFLEKPFSPADLLAAVVTPA